MKFNDLLDVADVNPTVKEQGYTYLGVGPLVKQPGSMPFRIALVTNDDQIIVWTQYFNTYRNDPFSGHLECSDPYFGGGHYFKPEELHLAMRRFGELLIKSADTTESIYRDKVAA